MFGFIIVYCFYLRRSQQVNGCKALGLGLLGLLDNIELQENAWTDRCKTYQDVYFFTRNLMA